MYVYNNKNVLYLDKKITFINELSVTIIGVHSVVSSNKKKIVKPQTYFTLSHGKLEYNYLIPPFIPDHPGVQS